MQKLHHDRKSKMKIKIQQQQKNAYIHKEEEKKKRNKSKTKGCASNKQTEKNETKWNERQRRTMQIVSNTCLYFGWAKMNTSPMPSIDVWHFNSER